ncbi:uncharacterized protein LOC113500227 [Trichoplusia ni]|uniref:Uncharacterized protein LOC113500227 n=1 Tax=Trichoplusia ni TaxID=7111 RepID=A0A7E5W8A2_TRINI|nr:uncharacterized protein LOC113500227 [Trichoplusia ni]
MADILIRRRGSMKAKLTNFSKYLSVLESNDELSDLQVLDLESRLSKFEKLYGEFDTLQTEIELLSDNPDDAHADRFKFEEMYHNLIATARKVITTEQGQRRQEQTSAGSVSGSEVTGGTRNLQPIMGQLPSSRSNLEFPFLNSSVDYAGPILIADRKGRGCKLVKSYICIFVCLAIKAVHLELVTDLTKEAYVAALKRFIARRGKPRSILSDNGTTFVGSDNQLRAFLQNSNLSYDVAQEGIEFNFVPAYSPHFNGVAEAAVRSTKHHLKRLLTLTHFTYEEMATCLTQIEAILNSRPLTPCSPDPLDFCALTPSHLLIGRSLTSVPHPQMTDSGNISRLERFQRVEYIKQHFWKRFNTEYIYLLQQKTKWSTTTGDIKVGSLVLVKDKALPPLCWLLGRVVQTYPGSDGVARVAELKTKKGTLRRAFNNICPLPLS